MRPMNGIKRIVDKKGNRLYVSTDGRMWEGVKLANIWQKKLNRNAVKVLEGKNICKKSGRKTEGKTRKNYHGNGGTVGVSPEKRRAMKAFIIKHNIASGRLVSNVISMNRLLWALSKDKKAVKDFAELFAVP